MNRPDGDRPEGTTPAPRPKPNPGPPRTYSALPAEQRIRVVQIFGPAFRKRLAEHLAARETAAGLTRAA